MQFAFGHIAGGTIRTCRFVKLSTTENSTVLEADANEKVVGISTEVQKEAPTPGASANAAVDGDHIAITPINSTADCLLEIGSGGCTSGDLLKSDADGKGVPVATTGTTIQYYGAMALETKAEGALCRVLPVFGAVRPALT